MTRAPIRRRSRRTGTKVSRPRRTLRPTSAERWRRSIAGAIGLAVAVWPAPVFADPPRPTDYRTEIVSVTPAVPEDPPLGLGPGGQILDSVLPITVDGMPVEIAVVSIWMEPPSRAPWLVAGLLAAIVGVVTIVGWGRRPRRMSALVVFAALAASGAGLWQTWSLPSETGPPIVHWVLPGIAAMLALATIAWPRWSAFTVRSLTLVASVQLVVWTVLRADVLFRAILPTGAPFWLDRAVTSSVGVLAVLTMYASVLAVVRMMSPSPRVGG